MIGEHIQYLDHITDAHVRIKGKDLNDSFKYAGIGLVNIMFNLESIEKKQTFAVRAEGDELETLLFDWLEKILLLMLIDKVILSDFNINIFFSAESNKYMLDGYGEGECIDLDKHELKVEIKGITYHQMKIIQYSDSNVVLIEYIVDL